LDEMAMATRHGAEGGRLWRLARGVDGRRVTPERETKSISSETTFEADSADKEQLTRTLLVLCERVSVRLKKQRLACKSVTLKLRTSDFKLRTRARSGFEPTQLATRLFLVARSLLEREMDGARFRLLGVSTADFVAAEAADQGDLVDKEIGREKAREHAIDSLREKFGTGAVVRGLAFRTGPRRS
jgi:DNA polymerase IV